MRHAEAPVLERPVPTVLESSAFVPALLFAAVTLA
jgi:hypothetical protein